MWYKKWVISDRYMGMIWKPLIFIGIKNARLLPRYSRVNVMDMANSKENGIGDQVLTTKESCSYLRITKPTYFKYIREGRIKAIKAGKGWKVLKSELDRFLRGDL
jgi:excisionase family DNA binding protein